MYYFQIELKSQYDLSSPVGYWSVCRTSRGFHARGVLLRIFGRGVPPGSPNSDPISDQNMPFFTPVFRPLFYRNQASYQ